MGKGRVVQVELEVDGNSQAACFYRCYGSEMVIVYYHHRYRCPIYASAERKCRFIDRVTKAQKMLCRTMDS